MLTPPKRLPAEPGIYLFKNEDGKVLYVGKANNLSKRVSSYFRPLDKLDPSRPWIKVLIGLISKIETIVVDNEVEALMLEANLIKQYQPKFNLHLPNNASYPLIKLTIEERLPRLQVVRQQGDDGARYFGPYLSSRAARQACELMRKIYGVHISNKPLSTNQKHRCFECQLADTPCPLNGEISPLEYRQQVDEAIKFLQGKRRRITTTLVKQMRLAAKTQRFELAQRLREAWRAAQEITETQRIISASKDSYNAIGAAVSDIYAVITILEVRHGRVVNQTRLSLATGPQETVPGLLRQFIISYYIHLSSLPKLTVIPCEIEDQLLITRWLREQTGQTLELRTAKRGQKRNLVALATKNANLALVTDSARDGRDLQSLGALKELLQLDFWPIRIEAVDISNLGSSTAVGATVCFINGHPDKNEYRRYQVKTIQGQNDLGMITEITARRFSDATRPIPDLYVVDGGPEQLKAASRGIALGRVKPRSLIAIAKKPDRLFLPGRSTPLDTVPSHLGLRLLGRIRDEAHRFGLDYQRQRQRHQFLQRSQR